MPSATLPSDQAGHIKILDGVRACSILMVMAGHLLPVGPKIFELNSTSATGGMSLFFILSGFLITRLLVADNNLSGFLVRRLTRIVPLAYLYAFVVFAFFNHDIMALANQLLFTLNFNQQYINSYSPHLWSLCMEIQFYLLMGVLFKFARAWAKWIVLILCLTVTVLKVHSGDAYSMLPQLRGDEILAGSLLYLSVNGHFGDHSRFWKIAERFLPVIALAFVVVCHPETGFLRTLRAYPALLLVGALMRTERKLITAVLTSRPMAYVAKISYALYVVHPIAASGILHGGDKVILYLVKRPITFAIAFAVAHWSTFHYEAMWNRLARRWVEARRPARAAAAAA
jgi:peptidoglycan/LPS O-acetylase OafA/YrhL